MQSSNEPLPLLREVSLKTDTLKCHIPEWGRDWHPTGNRFSWNPDTRMLLPSGFEIEVTESRPGRNAKSYEKSTRKVCFKREYVLAWINEKLIKKLECLSLNEVLELVKESHAKQKAETETVPGSREPEATTEDGRGDTV